MNLMSLTRIIPSVALGAATFALATGPLAAQDAEATSATLRAPAPEPEQKQIEVAFVLDTTGSMSGLIEGAKQKIWSIANEIATAKPTPSVKFGLIGYRDRSDAYVTKQFDLTDDLDAIYGHLTEFQAGGGGDTPESVNQALHEAVTKMSWSEDRDVLKIIFLVGDAPPHMDYEEVQYPETCEVAVKKDLIINTIQCGTMTPTTPIWQEIASASEGEYVALEQSGGMRAVSTPYDADISTLNRDLNSTVIVYGDRSKQALGMSKIRRNEAAAGEAVAERADYFAATAPAEPAARKVISGDEDLVEQVATGKVELEEINKEELPETFKDLDESELKAAVAEKQRKRVEIQSKLDSLIEKRKSYIEDERKRLAETDGQDSFDSKVTEIIREQGARKGISYPTNDTSE